MEYVVRNESVNPSNAVATFVQSTGTKVYESKPCHFGIHWIALAEYSQMSTHMSGIQEMFRYLDHFAVSKLATTSTRVKTMQYSVEGIDVYLVLTGISKTSFS